MRFIEIKWVRKYVDELVKRLKILLIGSGFNCFLDQVIARDEDRVDGVHFALARTAILWIAE